MENRTKEPEKMKEVQGIIEKELLVSVNEILLDGQGLTRPERENINIQTQEDMDRGLVQYLSYGNKGNKFILVIQIEYHSGEIDEFKVVGDDDDIKTISIEEFRSKLFIEPLDPDNVYFLKNDFKVVLRWLDNFNSRVFSHQISNPLFVSEYSKSTFKIEGYDNFQITLYKTRVFSEIVDVDCDVLAKTCVEPSKERDFINQVLQADRSPEKDEMDDIGATAFIQKNYILPDFEREKEIFSQKDNNRIDKIWLKGEKTLENINGELAHRYDCMIEGISMIGIEPVGLNPYNTGFSPARQFQREDAPEVNNQMDYSDFGNELFQTSFMVGDKLEQEDESRLDQDYKEVLKLRVEVEAEADELLNRIDFLTPLDNGRSMEKKPGWNKIEIAITTDVSAETELADIE